MQQINELKNSYTHQIQQIPQPKSHSVIALTKNQELKFLRFPIALARSSNNIFTPLTIFSDFISSLSKKARFLCFQIDQHTIVGRPKNANDESSFLFALSHHDLSSKFSSDTGKQA